MDIRAQFYEAARARAPRRVDAKAELYASVKALVDKEKSKKCERPALAEKTNRVDARAELLTSVQAVLGMKRVSAGCPTGVLAENAMTGSRDEDVECSSGRGSHGLLEEKLSSNAAKIDSEPLDIAPGPQRCVRNPNCLVYLPYGLPAGNSGSQGKGASKTSGSSVELAEVDKENVREDLNVIKRGQGGTSKHSRVSKPREANQVVHFEEEVSIFNSHGVQKAPLKKAKQTYPLAELYLLNPARKPKPAQTAASAQEGAKRSDRKEEQPTMSEQEKRQDTDGGWYTKSEFIKCYGGTAEWEKATRKAPPKPREPERRVSEEDGLSYTKAEFIDYYGGTEQWERAKPEKKNKDFVKDLSLLERRLAPDGRTYTKKQFIEFYGDLVEWDKAGERARIPKTNPAVQAKQQTGAPKKHSAKHAMSFSQATRGGQPTAGDVSRKAAARPPARPNQKLERRRAPDGTWLDKEEFVDCYSLEEWYNAEEETPNQPKEQEIPEKLSDHALQRLVAEINRLDESLQIEFRQVYAAAEMEPSSLSIEEVTEVEKQLKQVIMAEEKCLMVAKQYAAFLAQKSNEFFERKKLEGLEADYIRQYEYQLKAARAEFGDIQTERLEEIKGKLKMLYKTKDSTWMKWRGRRKELEDQIKHHGADPKFLKSGGQSSRRTQENGAAAHGAKKGAQHGRNDVKQLFIAALKHVVNTKKMSMPFNASSIMLAMQELSGKKFSMKDTPFSSLKGLVNEMVNEGHLKVTTVGNTLMVTSTVHAA